MPPSQGNVSALTQRQQNIIAAVALAEAARIYPKDSKPPIAYQNLADALWIEIGDWTEREYTAAFAAARALNPEGRRLM